MHLIMMHRCQKEMGNGTNWNERIYLVLWRLHGFFDFGSWEVMKSHGKSWKVVGEICLCYLFSGRMVERAESGGGPPAPPQTECVGYGVRFLERRSSSMNWVFWVSKRIGGVSELAIDSMRKFKRTSNSKGEQEIQRK
jgi:hypothetical protein